MRFFRFPFFLAVLMLTAANVVFAQTSGTQPPVQNTGRITGKLVDDQNKPVSYATVTLLRADSSVINGDLTKDDGSFSISPTGIGNFQLRIESMGAPTKFVNVQITADAPDKNIGKITVKQSANTLNEVSVVGEKPIMELKVDKKVFNVEKNTTTAGGSATDVLQNVPSLSVDADGNVSMRGKSGVTILIDGKPATMLGSDVASALQSLPAGSIESVEVITNPSAKYDAQGTGGIVNIITKKDGRLGINGTITLGAGTGDKYNGNFGLNVRKGKWNVFLNSSARINNSYNNVTTNRVDKIADTFGITHSYHTYEHVPRRFGGYFNTIGASFDPNKYNSITLTENINIMQFGFKDTSKYNVYGNPDELSPVTYQQQRYSSFVGMPVSLSTAIDYKHKFKKKDEELSFDATYVVMDFHRKQDYTTIDTVTSVKHAPGSGMNNTLNVWADYTDPLFTKNGKLGLGFKSQFYWFKSDDAPTISVNNGPAVFDPTLLAIYNYNQQIHAGYVNWSDQLNKFSYQAGLRIEDAVYDGEGKTPRDTTLHNSFLDLFPTAFVSYQLQNQQSVYLNYSRRTNRPGFMQLLPFVDLSNPGTVNTGNPALIPEFIHNIEFSYSKADNKGNNYILSTYYSYTQNLIEKITRPIDSADAIRYGVASSNLFSQPVNIASGSTFGLEGTGHVQILPIWDATINANFFQNQLIIGNKNPLLTTYLSDRTGNAWFGKVNTNLKLPKSFSFQVNANYESPKVVAQGKLKETYWVDVALRKNLWKNKATLVINCSDIFNTHAFLTNYDLATYRQVNNRVKETRVANITFTYRFGKSDAGKQPGGPGGMGKRDKTDKMNDKKKPEKPSDEDREKNLKEGDDSDQGGGGNQGGKGGGKGQ